MKNYTLTDFDQAFPEIPVKELHSCSGFRGDTTKQSSRPYHLETKEEKVQRVVGCFEGLHETGTGWTAKCPAHGDKNNSLSLSISPDETKLLINCFVGCKYSEIVKASGLEREDFMFGNPPETTATVQLGGTEACTVANYAKYKGLPQEFLKSLGLTDSIFKGHSRVHIPYFDESNEEKAVRYRHALQKTGDADFRFSWKSGAKLLLYGLFRLGKYKDSDFVVLVEGESDCHALWHHGIPALGFPGASNWKEAWAEHLDGFKTIYLIREPDKGGETVEEWAAKSKLSPKIHLVELGVHKDPSGLHLADPDNFITNFKLALKKAVSIAERQSAELREITEKAAVACEPIRILEDILGAFVSEFNRMGIVGVDREAKVLYLALTTRILPVPTSVTVKGTSSTGKSHAVEQVLRFFPEEAYLKKTSMSPRALAYTEEPLKHRFLVLAEAAGAMDDFFQFLIRTLLSEGYIRYEYVDKTPEGLKSQTKVIEGPTGLIITTTEVALHPENETRMLSMTLSDSEEQTRKIIDETGNEEQYTPDFTPWQALQTWLAGTNPEVHIPFRKHFVHAIPPVAVRLRRDVRQFLNLIRAHALLHQEHRERNEDGRVVATVREDYAAVLELVEDLFSQQLEATVSPAIRATIAAVEKIINEKFEENSDHSKEFATRAELARVLRLDKSSVSRRVKAALYAGYLKFPGKFEKSKLLMGDSIPEDVRVFPTVEQLEASVASGELSEPPRVLPDSPTIISEKWGQCVPRPSGEKKEVQQADLGGGEVGRAHE